jgi:hypothetical protein
MLLIFRTYPRIVKDLLSISITKQTAAIYKTMKEIHRLNAKQQVKETLVIRNSPNTEQLLRLIF